MLCDAAVFDKHTRLAQRQGRLDLPNLGASTMVRRAAPPEARCLARGGPLLVTPSNKKCLRWRDVMAWDFETEPEFQEKLDWIETFMKEEIEPLSHLGMAAYGPKAREKLIRPLQQKVKDQGLWACHLGPELGGQGFGQVKLGLMNEKLGRNSLAPTIFGCQAPDTGNAEIIAHYGTDAQKEQWLKPLLNGDIRSAYSMSEPTGGSDPPHLPHLRRAGGRRVGDTTVRSGSPPTPSGRPS